MPSKLCLHDLGGQPNPTDFAIPNKSSCAFLVDAFKNASEFNKLKNITLIGRTVDDGITGLDGLLPHSPLNIAEWYVDRNSKTWLRNPNIKIWQCGNEQTTNTPAVMLWWSNFTAEVVKIARERYNLGIMGGNQAVSNPSDINLWKFAKPMFEAFRIYGGIFGLHRYFGLVRTPAGEIDFHNTIHNPFYFGQIEKDYSVIESMGYADIDWFFGEIGLERLGNHVPFLEEVKRGNINALEYAQILHQIDLYLQTLPYVLGAAIFTNGDNGGDWPHNIANTSVASELIKLGQNNIWKLPFVRPLAVTYRKRFQVGEFGLNLREKPSQFTKWLGYLAPNSLVEVVGKTRDYVQTTGGEWVYTASGRLIEL